MHPLALEPLVRLSFVAEVALLRPQLHQLVLAVADAVKGDKDKKVDATGVYADNTAGYVVTLVDNDDDGNVEYAFSR
mgnify:CR=1 FL=1